MEKQKRAGEEEMDRLNGEWHDNGWWEGKIDRGAEARGQGRANLYGCEKKIMANESNGERDLIREYLLFTHCKKIMSNTEISKCLQFKVKKYFFLFQLYAVYKCQQKIIVYNSINKWKSIFADIALNQSDLGLVLVAKWFLTYDVSSY